MTSKSRWNHPSTFMMKEAERNFSSLDVKMKLIEMINLICHENLGEMNENTVRFFIEINSASISVVEDLCIKWIEKQSSDTCEHIIKFFFNINEETSI